jgi:hypothetical protein
MGKEKKLIVRGIEISILKSHGNDYISITDMIKAKDGAYFISDWLRNRNTIEFLGVWESIYNSNFNYGEFAIIKSNVGLNNYKISAKEWTQKTKAIGIVASRGRYGATYAHKDIAFEFGMWISAEFKIYLIKEFQRLKDDESKMFKLEWNLQRTLSKINYRIHTDAIKENIIPKILSKEQINLVYSNEADLLNMALFGETAASWRSKNPKLVGNIRDHSSLEQLVILSNLESINAVLIAKGIEKSVRLEELNKTAILQMKSLLKNEKNIKKLENS